MEKLIKSHGSLSDDSYKFINYYLLMIFHNYTVEDINLFEKYNQSMGQDLFSTIYKDIQNIYDSQKEIVDLKNYDLGGIDSFYNFTCQSYYNYLFNTNELLNNANNDFKQFLILVCEYLKIFNSGNYIIFFSNLLENVQIGINEIYDRSYEGLIKITEGPYFPIINLLFLSVYYYAFEILGVQIQRRTYFEINSMMLNYIKISFSFYYAISFIILLLMIIFEYIWRINTNIKKINVLKKVFRVCNKND